MIRSFAFLIILALSTASTAKMTCPSLLEGSTSIEEKLYDQLDSTYDDYFESPTAKALKKHIDAAEKYLGHYGVNYKRYADVLQITPHQNHAGTLNSFAKKVLNLTNALTVYDLETLKKEQTAGTLHFWVRENGKYSFDFLYLSYDAIRSQQSQGTEAHELSHGLISRFRANKDQNRINKGSVFSTSVLLYNNQTFSVEEVYAYFSTLSVLVSNLRNKRMHIEDFNAEFQEATEALRTYVDINQQALSYLKSNPLGYDNGIIQLGEMIYGTGNQSTVVLLSPRGNGSNVVTFLVDSEIKNPETKSALKSVVSMALINPFYFDVEADSLTSLINKSKLDSLIDQFNSQVEETSFLLSQMKALLETAPQNKNLSTDEANAFIKAYRQIIMPHLRARF